MSHPVPAAFAVCWCTHTQRRHHDNEGVCLAAGCDCTGFETGPPPVKLVEAPPLAAPRPVATPSPAPRAAPAKPDVARQPTLLERADQSPQRTTRLLGERIRGLLDDLRQVLAAEANVTQAQEEVAQLRAQLREAEIRARGGRKRIQPPRQCPHCAFNAGNGAGLTIHVRAKHPESEAQ